MLSIILCVYWPFACFLWKNVYEGLLLNFELQYFGFLLSCMYILEMEPLSIASFANIFSHFIGCLFNFCWFSLLCRTCKFV